MVDKKVYKTDYNSEFSDFFSTLNSKEEPVSIAKQAEKAKYKRINMMRDKTNNSSTRTKLWKEF